MNECKDDKHKWVSVPDPDPFWQGTCRDECELCGAVGYLDFKTGQVKAKPIARVIDLQTYRETRKIRDLKVKHG